MPRSRTAAPERELDTATADLDELQRQVAEAEERAARARAVIAERHEQAMQRRAEAQYAYDERTVDEYRATDRALVTAEQEARQRFLDALVADPVWGALVEMYAAQTRRRHRQFEAEVVPKFHELRDNFAEVAAGGAADSPGRVTALGSVTCR